MPTPCGRGRGARASRWRVCACAHRERRRHALARRSAQAPTTRAHRLHTAASVERRAATVCPRRGLGPKPWQNAGAQGELGNALKGRQLLLPNELLDLFHIDHSGFWRRPRLQELGCERLALVQRGPLRAGRAHGCVTRKPPSEISSPPSGRTARTRGSGGRTRVETTLGAPHNQPDQTLRSTRHAHAEQTMRLVGATTACARAERSTAVTLQWKSRAAALD